MSAASLVLAIAMAGNVVRFVKFGMKLCYRIQEYSTTDGAPKKLAVRADCLLDLLDVLGGLDEAEQDALERGLIVRCTQAATELSALLDTIVDKSGSGKWKWRYATKAWRSLYLEKKVERLQRTLESLLGPLSLHLQVKTTQQIFTIKCRIDQILEGQANGSSGNIDHRRTSKGLISETIAAIPVARNPGFVGREELLNRLDGYLCPKPCGQPKAVLYGLGGIGKSQIALEYAYRFIERFPKRSIFWVCAANTAKFKEAYRRIASEYEIPGWEDPDGDLMQLVQDWLERRYRSTWLMIVDNVDDTSAFFRKGASGKSLSEYVPQSTKGSILYTTRDRGIGANLVPPQGLISVPRLDSAEARDPLGEKITHESTVEEQSKLIERLDYLPFAISQAATSMTEIGLTTSQYLAHYRHSYSARIGLLSYGFADNLKGERPMESIATTRMISFNYFQKQNPRIPKSPLAGKDEDPLDSTKVIRMLDAFSLIAADDRRENCRVRLLAPLATRLWPTGNDNAAKKVPLALELVESCFQNGEYEYWTTCKVNLAHAEAVLHSACEEYPNTDRTAQATILLNTSRYSGNKGVFKLAEARARMSVHLHQERLGTKHPDTLSSISNLASVLHDLGDYQAAEVMYRQVLEGRVDALGRNNPETLISFSNLALNLQDQGRHKEAEDINREALERHEKVLGNRHPDTLACLNNLALVLQGQGKLKEAEEMHWRVLEASEETLGTEHPDTLVSLQNFAGLLRDQARYAEAEDVYRRALSGLERTLGKEHPFTLTSLHNLAEVLQYRGIYDEAEEIHRRALTGSKNALGNAHPYTLTSLYNLAELLRDREKLDDAEKMHRLALEGREKVLGKTHLDTLASASCLALVLRDQRKYSEAEEMSRQALARYEDSLREGNPSTLATIRSNLALLLQEHADENANQAPGE